MGETSFLVLGGDKRQLYAAERLAEKGLAVHICALGEEGCADVAGAVAEATHIVLPLPVTRDGSTLNAPLCSSKIQLKGVFECLNSGQTVFAGMIAPEMCGELAERGIVCRDYFRREELSVLNAVATAEGVVMEAVGAMPVNIHSSSCCVVGFGKTGSYTAKLLTAMGAHVTVAARSRRDLAKAFTFGCRGVPLDDICAYVPEFDLLVNTVPAQVVGSKILSWLKKSCVLIEIASAPYGIDSDFATSIGLKYINAPSLPGRVSPKTSGESIADTVICMAREGD